MKKGNLTVVEDLAVGKGKGVSADQDLEQDLMAPRVLARPVTPEAGMPCSSAAPVSRIRRMPECEEESRGLERWRDHVPSSLLLPRKAAKEDHFLFKAVREREVEDHVPWRIRSVHCTRGAKNCTGHSEVSRPHYQRGRRELA